MQTTVGRSILVSFGLSAALAFGATACSSSSSGGSITVSPACSAAFTALNAADQDIHASEDAQQLATLNDCKTGAEWKAAAAPYQGTLFPGKNNPAGVTLDDSLRNVCDGHESAPACANP